MRFRVITLGMALCVSACAHWPDSLGGAISNHETKVENGASKLLLVIRYPATITPEAATRLHYEFAMAQYSDCPMGISCTRNPSTFEDSLVKTSFYVQEIYSYLKDHLPIGSVVLEPAKVDVDGDAYKYTEIYDGLTGYINIDFFAYNSPLQYNSHSFSPATEGQFYAPMLVGTSDGYISAKGGGIVFLTDGLSIPSYRGGSYPYIANAFSHQREASSYASSNYPLKQGDVFKFPIKYLEIRDEDWKHYVTNFTRGAISSNKISKDYGNIIIESLYLIDNAMADEHSLKQSRDFYEKKGIKIGDGILRALQATEARFMAARSEAIANLIRERISPAVCARLETEREAYGKYFEAGYRGAAMMMVAGVAGGITGAGFVNPGVYQAYASGMQATQDISQIYEANFSAINGIQANVILEFGGQQTKINAASVSELRDKLAVLAQKYGN